jgi:hypothetical protein
MKTKEGNGKVPMILMLSNYWNPTTNVKRYFQAGGSPVALESRGENNPFRGAAAREYSLELWDVSAQADWQHAP